MEPVKPDTRGGRRWKQALKWLVVGMVVGLATVAYVFKDTVRTLSSLRRVPNTNAYVLDYYLDYNLEEIRRAGMDVEHLEDSCLRTMLPDILMPVVTRLKKLYLGDPIQTVAARGPQCSTVFLRPDGGEVFFGRNFDWHHDACLMVRIHDPAGVASIALIDLAYLNLNRTDLEESTLLERLPLVFAPYYVMDGMNRHGLAVSTMAVEATPPRDAGKPDILHSTLMRVMLDYASNVDEAVEIVGDYNVHFVDTEAHLMVGDASGRSQIIEYVDGEVRVTPSEGSWQVCANTLVWKKTEEEKDALCNRYRTGSGLAEQRGGLVDYDGALEVVRSMSVNFTMWTSVYNLTTREARLLYRSRPETEYSSTFEVSP